MRWGLAVAAALILFIVGVTVVMQPESTPDTPAPAVANQPTGYISVVTATQTLEAGTQITPDMLTVVMWPEDAERPGPIVSNPTDVIGMYIRGQTSQYMPVLQYNVTDEAPPTGDESVAERNI